MKYIDAEELLSLLRKRYNTYKIGQHGPFRNGKVETLRETIELIDSLQQEQRETDGDDGKFVKILVRKEFAELFQKLGDEIQAGQSSFVGAMNQQEQPEVDLEVRKQIEELANDWHHKGFASDEDCPLCMQDLMDILWHFYELGKKDMKEQMLKDAVEGYVNYYEDSGGILMAEAQVGCPYHIGDKVRLIIVKEE